MSKHNYSQYSNKKDNRQNTNNNRPNPNLNKSVPKSNPAEEKVMVNMVKETVETVKLPEIVKGFVVNCAKLNLREKPTTDSEIVCVLDSMSEIEIDVNKSTNAWVYVYTAAGLEGYCMKQYIEASL